MADPAWRAPGRRPAVDPKGTARRQRGDAPRARRAVSFSRFRGPPLKVDEASSLVFADQATRQDASSTLNDTALPAPGAAPPGR